MADALVPAAERLPAAPGLADTLELAAGYARAARADNTRRAYRAAWADFAAWCRDRGLAELPAAPETVGAFLAERAATHKPASLQLRLVAVRQAHRLAGHDLRADHPAVRDVMQGIRRTHGTAPAKKEATVTEILRDAVRALAKAGDGLRSRRDRALLLVGFAAALRRSELAALDAADAVLARDGLVLTLRRRKTDQEGGGTEIGVPFGRDELTCPVRALRA
jgi:site-specific recombinase XerD